MPNFRGSIILLVAILGTAHVLRKVLRLKSSGKELRCDIDKSEFKKVIITWFLISYYQVWSTSLSLPSLLSPRRAISMIKQDFVLLYSHSVYLAFFVKFHVNFMIFTPHSIFDCSHWRMWELYLSPLELWEI